MSPNNDFIFFETFIDERILPLGYSFQNEGTYLNSKNDYYKNIPVLSNNMPSFKDILIDVFNITEKVNILKHKNIKDETPFKKKYDKVINFPQDSLVKKFLDFRT